MTVNTETLAKVHALAAEVAGMAKDIIAEKKANAPHNAKALAAHKRGDYSIWYREVSSVKTAAVKRRSMDLTRALAELRKS